jgi:hypothetical protein
MGARCITRRDGLSSRPGSRGDLYPSFGGRDVRVTAPAIGGQYRPNTASTVFMISPGLSPELIVETHPARSSVATPAPIERARRCVGVRTVRTRPRQRVIQPTVKQSVAAESNTSPPVVIGRPVWALVGVRTRRTRAAAHQRSPFPKVRRSSPGPWAMPNASASGKAGSSATRRVCWPSTGTTRWRNDADNRHHAPRRKGDALDEALQNRDGGPAPPNSVRSTVATGRSGALIPITSPRAISWLRRRSAAALRDRLRIRGRSRRTHDPPARGRSSGCSAR